MSIHTETDPRLDELETRLAATRAELRDLATMGAVITSIHEINAVLSVVMDMAIRLADGEVGLIMLEEEGELKVKISWGVSEEFIRTFSYKDDLDLPSYCFKDRQTIILNDLSLKDEKGFSIESVICLPIQTANKCHGVMLIINKANGGSYTEEDKESLEMLLNFVAVAIDNSILMQEQLKQQKVEQEMAIARQIQGTILPQDIDSIQGVDIGAVYFPAREVGGDFYEVHKLDESRFFVVIGDVSNKGVPAALIMAAASGIMKSIITAQPDISVSELASKLNNLLAEHIIKDREMFVTLFFTRFDLDKKLLTYCNGGHVPGLFWDARQQVVCELAEGGPIVGQFPGVKFQQGERSLSTDDRLFLFTDGLTEAEDKDGNMFGREQAAKVLKSEVHLSPREFCLKVKEWVDQYTVGSSEESHDDFTILQVRIS